MIPYINIKYNRFLDPLCVGWVKARPIYKNISIPSKSTVLKRAKHYNKLWAIHGHKILRGIVRATGLSFKRNWIDVHVVSLHSRPFSSPIVIKSRYSDTDFINVLTHELIHCLFSDNKGLINSIIPWVPLDKCDTCNDHVFLHAILEYIYVDVLKSPAHLKRNIQVSSTPGNEGYATAWKIVRGNSYQKIIKEFKKRIVSRRSK